VEKSYEGPARFANAARERACLSALEDHLPVARIVHVDLDVPRLTLSFVTGAHGQDLIDDGHGDPVEDLAWAEWLIRMHHPEEQ
jgi:hypothetical protein